MEGGRERDEGRLKSPAGEDAEGHTEKRRLTKGKVLLLNTGLLTGILASAYMVAPSTPLWAWASVSGVTLLGLNWALLSSKRSAARRGSPEHRKAVVIILLGLALLLAILFGHLHA